MTKTLGNFMLVIAISCMTATAFAQQQQPIRQGVRERGERIGDRARDDRAVQQTAATNSDNQSQGQNLDQAFAACLLQANEAEVKLAKIAADRATNKDVKEFAEQMIKDHSAVVDKLQKIAGNQQPTDRRAQVEKQINDRCFAMLQEELESKSGKEFDACYIGSQISGHMHMTAALEVLANESSGQLQQIVKEAQPTIEKHFKHAKQLMKDVDSRQASN